MTIQTVADLEWLPGVRRVLRATPQPGHVTLLVDGEWTGPLGLVSNGDGLGEFPVGMVVHADRWDGPPA